MIIRQNNIFTFKRSLIFFFILTLCFHPRTFAENERDLDGELDVFRKELLKEALYADKRISAMAMFNLGSSYLSDDNSTDFIQAYMWFTISAARNEGNAFYAVSSRKKVIAKMTAEQIATAEEKAHLWMMDHWGEAPINMEDADFGELQRRLTAGDDRALDEIIRRADADDHAAQITLGEMYWWNIAVKSDPQKALFWWKKAAESGNVEIMTKLALFFLEGHPGHKLPPDPLEGEMWLLKAGNEGYVAAAHLLTALYRDGNGPIAANPQKYRFWYEKWADSAAKNGDFSISSRLAGLYNGNVDLESNHKWPQDSHKVFTLFHKAAEGGDIHAQTKLAESYLYGQGIEKDEEKALKWFIKAADCDAPGITAWAHLVIMYEQGIGTEKNIDETKKWLDRIMANPLYAAGSLHMIGNLYEEGKILPIDYSRAAHYYRLSAIRGKPEAQFSLGQCFWEGNGVPQSKIDAYTWWTIALDNLFDPSIYPFPLVKSSLNNAEKSINQFEKTAAIAKKEQLINEFEDLGIIEGKKMGDVLKKSYQFMKNME